MARVSAIENWEIAQLHFQNNEEYSQKKIEDRTRIQIFINF